MKLLRILTGLHAGAQLLLDNGMYIVGNQAGVDVHITDWKHAPIRLTVEEGQAVAIASLGADESANLEMPALQDLMARRFKEVVLCVGPADDDWPSDIRLLEKLVRPEARPSKPEPKPQRSVLPAAGRQKMMIYAGAALSVALLSGFGMIVSRNNAHASQVSQPVLQQVQRAVQGVGAPGIMVRASEDRVLVEGLVADDGLASRLRAALRPFPPALVVQRFASGETLAQSITDALATPGVSVRYRGDGLFLVDGRSQDLDRLRADARRVAADLGPLIQRIEFAVAEMPAPERIPMSSMLASEDLRYVQTRDGTKHLFLKQPVVAPESAAGAIAR
ncbi:hypothetical protein HLB44_36350 [Aquincola sp. S2]|uniref:Type III secretion protein D n=1 Tax=Pseudaquabacterium terrae TaxID=2732868 RepID=A0ABX2EUL6_9BURK|nr:HrpD5 family protein [Aquabacterium terrae]NRF72435.1 hypothetical protein [Aquabacterium terrae]